MRRFREWGNLLLRYATRNPDQPLPLTDHVQATGADLHQYAILVRYLKDPRESEYIVNSDELPDSDERFKAFRRQVATMASHIIRISLHISLNPSISDQEANDAKPISSAFYDPQNTSHQLPVLLFLADTEDDGEVPYYVEAS